MEIEFGQHRLHWLRILAFLVGIKTIIIISGDSWVPSFRKSYFVRSWELVEMNGRSSVLVRSVAVGTLPPVKHWETEVLTCPSDLFQVTELEKKYSSQVLWQLQIHLSLLIQFISYNFLLTFSHCSPVRKTFIKTVGWRCVLYLV